MIKKRFYRKKKVLRRKRTFKRRVPRVSIEKKHLDYNISQAITQAGSLTLMSNVSQGVGDTQRIGTKAYLLSMFCHFIFAQNPASTVDNIRLMMIVDKQGYNSPVVTDVLEPGTVGGGLAPISQFNRNYMGRFRILFDKMFTLDNVNRQSIEFRKILRINVKSHYIGAGTTFMNQVYLLHIGDNGNVLQLPIINGVFRLMYTDD